MLYLYLYLQFGRAGYPGLYYLLFSMVIVLLSSFLGMVLRALFSCTNFHNDMVHSSRLQVMVEVLECSYTSSFDLFSSENH